MSVEKSWNAFAGPGCNILMMAAPSRMLTCTMIIKKFSLTGVRSSKQCNISHDGGVVRSTVNSAALRHWMVSSHEMARVIGEFDGSIQKKQHVDYCHHEQNKYAQTPFAKDVKSLSSTMEEVGNSFSESSSDLLVLDSRKIADSSAATDTVFQIENLGLQMNETYMYVNE